MTKPKKARKRLRRKNLLDQYREAQPEWTPFQTAHYPEGTPPDDGDTIGVWRNSRYQVVGYLVEVPQFPGEKMTHLSIKRHDKEPIHDWREKQRIKNELLGPEREAVELHPAESRLVDTSNQFHLWVLEPGFRFPFGYEMRIVSEDESMGNKQRPFEDKPDDLGTHDEMIRRYFGENQNEEE